jgi:hypothetical protein
MKLLDAVLSRPVATVAQGVAIPGSAPGAVRALDLPAAEVCALFKTSQGALCLLDDGPGVAVALDRFVSSGHLAEARRLLAYAMERRDAVWWAFLCAAEALRHKPMEPSQARGLDLALAWLVNPSDSGRRECKNAIYACGPTSIAGILCLAVWLSGGSISPYAGRHIEPNPHACGKLCGAVVYLCSVYFDPIRWKTCLRHFIDTGLCVARGECPVPAPNEAPAS